MQPTPHLIRNGRLALAAMALLSGWLPLASAEAVRVNGSGSALDMLKPMIVAYNKAKPQIRIDSSKPLGSSGAMKALLGGALDLAVTSKPATPQDLAQGARFHEYGVTPLLIITGANAGKTDITSAELADIYAGTLKAWPSGEKIRVVLRPEGDIDTSILQGLSPRMRDAMGVAQGRPGMIVAVTDPESNGVVAKTAGAIGASALCGILVEHPAVNILTLNGISPSTKTIANGTYPLVKTINFVTTAKGSTEALDFMAFAFSPAGRRIAEQAGVLVIAK